MKRSGRDSAKWRSLTNVQLGTAPLKFFRKVLDRQSRQCWRSSLCGRRREILMIVIDVNRLVYGHARYANVDNKEYS